MKPQAAIEAQAAIEVYRYCSNWQLIPAHQKGGVLHIGRGLFSDYYNDNNHHFTFKEQIDEVYQWRNHVYSRPQDNRKITPLSESDIEQLSKSIHEGGLLLDYRAIPVSQ